MESTASDYTDDIAIIGLAGRFPGAPDIETFWQNLCAGHESLARFSEQDLDRAGVPAALRNRPDYVRAGMPLDDVELFDAGFFTFTPREAEIIDPQHRLFLECAWTALEHAGYAADTYPGAIGLFAGVGMSTYMLFNLFPHHGAHDTVSSFQMMIGNDKDFLSTRASYKLNLKGPSVTVQTACSTSLVAIHLACQSLLSGESDIALAGGVSILLPQTSGYLYQSGMILSPDGHCRAFDVDAQGTIRGNGMGIVVLKPLENALNDGDYIHAVIKGTAINNDGSSKIGYTAPSMEYQRDVIAQAQGVARTAPETISYIEAHGTGTPLGDPVEIEALSQAFRLSTEQNQFCAIGSVKTNIGHLAEAAGAAGLIKTVLMLKHQQIPPSLHFKQPNPKIDFAHSPFYVNAQLAPWKAGATPRRAGVSAFGIGGTNAHVIVEEAPSLPPSGAARPQHLLLLSAKSSAALEQATLNLSAYLRQHPQEKLADVAYTLQVGRKQFSHRQMLVCESLEDALSVLEQQSPERLWSMYQEATDRPVAFMFPGQGAQYVGMGRELYEGEPTFRAAIDRCAALFRPHIGRDLRNVLYGADEDQTSAADNLKQTALAQPALFMVEYALAQLWMEWGVQPQAMVGHSIGEYVAACLAGVLSLEDAAQLVALRGQLMQSLPAGAMLSVELPEAALQSRLQAPLALAAVNGVNACVVSGPLEAIHALHEQLTAEQVACRYLVTSHAFHSAMMDPILGRFTERLRQIRLHPPQVPFLSNVTGRWITAAEATSPAYWANQLRQTVRFHDNLQLLLQDSNTVLLEVGPGHTLSTLARQHPRKAADQIIVSSLRHPNDQQPDQTFVLNALGKLWLAGVPIDWPGFYSHEQRQRLPLPTYPFERQRYWVDPPGVTTDPVPPSVAAANGPDLTGWFYRPTWQRSEQPTASPADLLAGPKRRWLVFMDTCGLGENLAQRLKQAGHTVVQVEGHDRFSRGGSDGYTLRPDSAEDYHALISALRQQNQLPEVVVHCWGVTPGRTVPPDQQALQQSQARGLYSLLFLAQALGREHPVEPCQIWIVTSDMQAVTGRELLCAEKATVLGPAQVIPQEYPGLECRNIDLTLSEPAMEPAQAAEHVLGEIAIAAATSNSIVAYREQQRWLRHFEPLRLEQQGDRTRLRQRGVYLITGGLGGIGLTLAQHLAQSVQARLILVGRSPLPPRDTWDAWLSQPERPSQVADRIRKVRALEAAGAEVIVAGADVANREEMQAVLDRAQQRFGPVNGIIHAAGIAGGGLIQLRAPEAIANVLAAKLYGTLVLEALFRDQPLDFLLLCSSLTALLGGVGQVDYTGANAFLDAFAQAARVERDTFTVAVNWDTWKEVGMAAQAVQGFYPESVATYTDVAHPLLDQRIVEESGKVIYIAHLSVARHWVVAEHRLYGTALLPGTAYVEMARAACEPYAEGRPLQIRDVFLLAPLQVEETETKEVRVILQSSGEEMRFVIASQSEAGGWQEHARGTVSWEAIASPSRYDLEALAVQQGLAAAVPVPTNSSMPEAGLTLGAHWHSLQHVRWGRKQALACLEVPPDLASDLGAWGLHPALMDVAVGFVTLTHGDAMYLPFTYKQVQVFAPLPGKIYSYVRDKTDQLANQDTLLLDILLLDEDGRALVRIEDYTLRRIAPIATLDLPRGLTAARPEQPAVKRVTAADDLYLTEAERRQTLARPLQADYLNLEQGILSDEGVAAFQRILSQDNPQVIVSTQDWLTRVEQAQTHTLLDYLAVAPTTDPLKPAQPRPALANPYVPPRNDLEQSIVNVWQDVLGIAELGIHDNFFELGGTSLISLQVTSRLKEALGIDIQPVRLFEGPTVSALAELIRQETKQPTYTEEASRGKLRKESLRRKLQTNERREL